MSSILDQVEASMVDFQPRTQSEFAVLQIAKHFDDVHRLPRYILAAQKHAKRVLLDAARTAMLRHELNRAPTGDLFFEVLAEREQEETP